MKKILFLIIPLFITLKLSGQAYCPNSDFSLGNFDHWIGYYGTFWEPELLMGTVDSHHSIFGSSMPDPHAPTIMTLPPGENTCARLGNDVNGAEAEVLKYTFNVTSENNLFIYKYAVVLEDPGHSPEKQPSFTIEVKNQSGELFDPVCGYYYVYAQPGMPGWETNADCTLVWKNWTAVGLNLDPMVGQSVSIVFTTRDCSESGHFGYAYLTTHCEKLQLHVGGCLEDSVVNVTAPLGFRYSWSTGDTTQSIRIIHPVAGMVVTCMLTAVNGCQVSISAVVQPTLIQAEFNFEPNCTGVPVPFVDQSTTTYNPVSMWEWNFDDGTPVVHGIQHPMHTFSDPGTYHVTFIPKTNEGCSDTIMKEVTILPAVDVDLGDDISINWDQTATFDAGNPGSEYIWSTGDSTQIITTTGDQLIWVKAQNEYCSDSDTLLLHQFPRCLSGIPTAFSPNGDGENDVLKLYGSGFANFELLIYDRSGQLVFKSNNPDETWDGTFGGKKLGMGVFNYILRGQCYDNSKFSLKGNITLLK